MGVPMAAMQRIAKPLGPDHDLAAALWETDWYEARMVACLIDDPALVTPEQMDRWRIDFDNWASSTPSASSCSTASPTPAHMIEPWAGLNDEFGRRAAFALLACMALHGRRRRLHARPRAHRGRRDRRAQLREEGRDLGAARDRRQEGRALRAAARELAARLAASSDPTARWNGKDALAPSPRPTLGRS